MARAWAPFPWGLRVRMSVGEQNGIHSKRGVRATTRTNGSMPRGRADMLDPLGLLAIRRGVDDKRMLRTALHAPKTYRVAATLIPQTGRTHLLISQAFFVSPTSGKGTTRMSARGNTTGFL